MPDRTDERRAQRAGNADVYDLLVERSRRRFGGELSNYADQPDPFGSDAA